MDPVSIVIPCYNPAAYAFEALASARAQSHAKVEIVVVDDGTASPEGRAVLEGLAPLADRFIRQPNRGLAAARNAGFAAAGGRWAVPLDCDDLLEPAFVERCLAEAARSPEAAFVYTDHRVFGVENYVEHPGAYNLYGLLDRNPLTYAALIRKRAWEEAGGYDEAMRPGYEDWEFWLNLGERGGFGVYVPETLFRYRKHGPSLLDQARRHHDVLTGRIRSKHPALYSAEGRARVKARWQPAAYVLGAWPGPEQTIEDWREIPACSRPGESQAASGAAFVTPGNGPAESNSLELAALAVWSGRQEIVLPGGVRAASWKRHAGGGASSLPSPAPAGPVAEPAHGLRRWHRHLVNAGLLSAEAWLRHPVRCLARLVPRKRHAGGGASSLPSPASAGPVAEPAHGLRRWHRHLVNAGLLSAEAWRRHPVRCLTRLVPLRWKEQANRLAGRPVFDLAFYLRFQPRSVLLSGAVVSRLDYLVRPASGRRRIALVTPHLGSGGAETVLEEIAGSLDRARYEILLIATHSSDSSREGRWRGLADHVYDLAAAVAPERVPAALFSIALNWNLDALLIQNSLAAYAALPALKAEAPGMRVFDLIHAVDEEWDVVSASAPVSGHIDVRVAISEAARRRLMASGVEEGRIRLIRNGVDLERFSRLPEAERGAEGVLFAGRLDGVKRPLLLVDIAAELRRRAPGRNIRFTVAGDGPEAPALRRRVQARGVAAQFDLRGHVDDVRPLLAAADLLLLPSEKEGIPLIVLEAFACGVPVVASDAGAVREAVDERTGIVIARGGDEPGEFADAILKLLDDPELRQRMGREGRRKAEAEFDAQAARQAYRELFG